MAVAAGQLEAPGPKPREIWFTFGMSVVFHSLLVTAITLIPHLRVGTYITVPVSYTVSLVSAPPGGQSKGGQPPAPAPPAAPKPAPPAPAPRAAPAPPAAPKPTEELTLPGRQVVRKPTREEEPSLRPPTPPRQEARRPAPPSPAPPTPAPPVTAPPAPVAAPPPAVASVQPNAGAGAGKGREVELSSEGKGGGGGTGLDVYLTLVEWKIRSNWNPLTVAQVPAIVRFRVLRSGQVRDVELETSSGDIGLDNAALRAIRQSAPLPPFSNLLTEASLDLRSRFFAERE